MKQLIFLLSLLFCLESFVKVDEINSSVIQSDFNTIVSKKESKPITKNSYPIWLDKSNLIIAKFKINGSVTANAFIETGFQNPTFDKSFVLKNKAKLKLKLIATHKISCNYLMSNTQNFAIYQIKSNLKINDQNFSKGILVYDLRKTGYMNADLAIPLIAMGDIIELNIAKGYVRKLDRTELESYSKGFSAFEMEGGRYELFSLQSKLQIYDSLGRKEELTTKLILDTGCGNEFVLSTNYPLIRDFLKKSDRMLLKDSSRIVNSGYKELHVLMPTKVLFNQFELKNAPIIAVKTFVNSGNATGFIGVNFFKQFDIIFDYEKKIVYLKHND